MSEIEYQHIRQKLQECFEKQEMEEGLLIAVDIKERFPEKSSSAYFNLAYFQAVLNKVGEMIETLKEGYEKGIWWSESSIRLFPNFDELYKKPSFNKIISKYFDRYHQIRENTVFKWVVRTPDNYDPSKKFPVLFAMHQGDSNIEETEKMWDSVLKQDILLALPQSSEITGENSYTWLNIDNGLQELYEIYSEILKTYQIDLNNVFLSGSSIGGKLAIEATFVRPQFPVKGCIAVNPSLLELDSISKSLKNSNNEYAMCSILVGTNDPDYQKIKELAKIFKEEKVNNIVYEIPGLGHAFPENFEELLTKTMDFLLMN